MRRRGDYPAANLSLVSFVHFSTALRLRSLSSFTGSSMRSERKKAILFSLKQYKLDNVIYVKERDYSKRRNHVALGFFSTATNSSFEQISCKEEKTKHYTNQNVCKIISKNENLSLKNSLFRW